MSIIVRGRVQGVYFRQSAMVEALKLGITGTARNLADGEVEVIATGTTDDLQKFTGWCRTGPKNARVDSVDVNILPVRHFESFNIIR